MNKRALLITFALWLAALGWGVKWGTNPVLRPPEPNLAGITAKTTARSFPLHLAPLHGKESSIMAHNRELDEDEDARPPTAFNYESWAFREMRVRLIVFLIIWTVGGLIVHWAVSRIFRETRREANKA